MKILLKILGLMFILVLVVVGIIFLYLHFKGIRVTAEFEEAAPFPPNMQVFYKGFKIGRVGKIYPADDYTVTRMEIIISPEDAKIPDNVSVRVKSYKDDFDYVDIVAPELASTEFLKNGSVIKGTTSLNVNEFFMKHIEEGTMDFVIQGAADVMQSLNKTIEQTQGFVSELTKTVEMMRPGLVSTTDRFSVFSENLSGTSLKINNSVDQRKLNNTMNNIEQSSYNLRSIMQKLDCATEEVPQTMSNINSITEDASQITSGVKGTLKKRFGGFRLIFGKPISNSCN